jgi:methyltransferase (TIGR00027 family)
VEEGTASHTARSVAARRLEYDRAAAPYGDPAADEALSSDVADGLTPARGRMHEYIRARTAFFDRVVVASIDRGVTQVVIGGAGYDGRAFRYAKPGVRWFEVDHPATQADKLERITRLGLATSQLSFIPADFTADPVAEPLLAAGLDPARPALFLFEGVAVYLEQPVIERVLTEFRAVTPVASPLAISVSIRGATSQTRASFQQRVAEVGEPARTVITFDQAAGLLSAAGWKIREGSDRQRSAGLLLAHAAAAPGHPERERLTPPPSVPLAASQASAGPPAGPATAPRRAPGPGPARLPADPWLRPVHQAGPGRQAGRSPPGWRSALRADQPGTATSVASQPAPPGQPGSAFPGDLARSPACGFAADLPLWALLSRPLLAFARQYEAALGPSLAISANVLRVLTEAGMRTKDIPAAGGVSKEAVAMAIGVMRKFGTATEGPDPAGSRFKVTRLTARGVALREEYPALAADIERDWRTRFGDARVTALRQALEALVAGDPPRLYAGLEPYPDGWRARVPPPATLPHYPMTLHRGGYPDGS